jgi:hypoxanthine phosphoribosyltransferase
MPEIKCDYGHATHLGTPQWIELLTLDQMRRAVELMGEKITAAEAQPNRVIRRICRGGICLANYREDWYEAAADHFQRIHKESFMEEAAADYVKRSYGTEVLRRELPSIEIKRVTQFEYDTEWFPPFNPA